MRFTVGIMSADGEFIEDLAWAGHSLGGDPGSRVADVVPGRSRHRLYVRRLRPARPYRLLEPAIGQLRVPGWQPARHDGDLRAESVLAPLSVRLAARFWAISGPRPVLQARSGPRIPASRSARGRSRSGSPEALPRTVAPATLPTARGARSERDYAWIMPSPMPDDPPSGCLDRPGPARSECRRSRST